MDRDKITRTSNFLSYVLRHRPNVIALRLDRHGWADVDESISAARARGRPVSRELLERVVRENDKPRFVFSEDGRRIRASQGHSVPVDLQLEAVRPPSVLYHGTAEHFLPAIREQGLLRGERHHVHLSPDAETATAVGRRHGRVVVLEVDSGKMHQAGYDFFRSANGVWLVDEVPAAYIELAGPG